jgi:hypothetical protein
MGVMVGQDKGLPTRLDAKHDLPTGLQIDVASFIGSRRRPSGVILAVTPLYLAAIPASAERKQETLFCHDDALVADRRIGDNNSVICSVQLPFVNLAVSA